MGNCVGGSGPADQKAKSLKKFKFSPMELTLLQLMYQNLSIRCRNHLVTREIFDVFFHANGLIGQILFQRFDAKKKGTISLQQFLMAFQLMTKGNLQQRADVLFEIYDVGNTGGVNYQELLKILFSYAPEQLNKMFSEVNFLKYIGQGQLSYYFGAEHKIIQQKMILQEQSQSQDHQKSKNNKAGYVPGSAVLVKMETQLNQGNRPKPSNIEIKNNLLNPSNDLKSPLKKPKNESKKIDRTLSSVINQSKFARKNLKVKSNIASLTKKYANFLFANYNLDKDKGVFSKKNFFQLVQQHSSLFNVYLSGFHLYVWQVDTNDQPEFKNLLSWVEGEAEQVYQQKQQSVYLKYVRTTIFVLSHKKAKVPQAIINLEGLTVEVLLTRSGKPAFGITFKQRDGLYPAKQYFFSSKQEHSEWTKLLAEFMHGSMQDEYIKLQRIGGGNYSNVFRGKNKKTGQQVAIKVMQTFKLSVAQKQVLKREVGILKQCHHPNIIKFYEQYKTKTDLCIITQICTEGDLFQYTKKHGFLEEYQAAIVFKQLVDAMLYLNNELGIVHRDLKPQNVLIKMSEDKKIVKRIKLIDFGFGVFKDKIKDLPIKQKFVGTPGFIAPEIYKQEEYDEKIDTFSLGIILHFMLSGQFPFHSPFLQEIQALTKSCSVSLVNNHWANVSEQAKDLILKILSLKETRLSTKQVSQHPWLQNIDNLKAYEGRNTKNRKNLALKA